MLIGAGPDGQILVVGAHHIEPTLVPDVGYTEVIAVASDARGTYFGTIRSIDGTLAAVLGQEALLRLPREVSGPTGPSR